MELDSERLEALWIAACDEMDEIESEFNRQLQVPRVQLQQGSGEPVFNKR